MYEHGRAAALGQMERVFIYIYIYIYIQAVDQHSSGIQGRQSWLCSSAATINSKLLIGFLLHRVEDINLGVVLGNLVLS